LEATDSSLQSQIDAINTNVSSSVSTLEAADSDLSARVTSVEGCLDDYFRKLATIDCATVNQAFQAGLAAYTPDSGDGAL